MYKVLLLTAALLFSTPALAGGDVDVDVFIPFPFFGGPFIDPYPCSYPDCPGNPYVDEYLYNRDKWEHKQWKRWKKERDDWDDD